MNRVLVGFLFLIASACGGSGDTKAETESTFSENSMVDEIFESRLYPIVGNVASFEQGVTEVSPDTSPMRLFVIREGNDFRILSDSDPNNGCRLTLDFSDDELSGEAAISEQTEFFDMCHGSQYDISGNLLVSLKSEYSERMNQFDFEIVDGQITVGDQL